VGVAPIKGIRLKSGDVGVITQRENVRQSNWENRSEPYSVDFHFI
jgi:hypothetical protein